MCQKNSIYAGFQDFKFVQVASRSKPISPIFPFVLARHKGLEDLGRVVVLFFVSITLFVEIMSSISNCI